MYPLSTRFLIVDDIQSLRDLLKAYLHRLGYYNLFDVADGQAALDLLWQMQMKNEPIHVVISDWNMPELSGLELLKRVRMVPDWKDLPFLLLTTESEKSRIVEAVQAQVTNYMVKPVDEETLKDKLKRTFERAQLRV